MKIDCPSCGAENHDSGRECNTCGQSLRIPALATIHESMPLMVQDCPDLLRDDPDGLGAASLGTGSFLLPGFKPATLH